MGEAIIRSESEDGPKVMRLSALEAEVLQQRFAGLVVEQDIQYRLPRTPLMPNIEPIMVPQRRGKTLRVRVEGNGKPVAGATVRLLTDIGRCRGYEGVTDQTGTCGIQVRSTDRKFVKLIVQPGWGFWSQVKRDVPIAASLTIRLKSLPVGGFDWGLRATAADQRKKHLGQGVKVAVIDSGIARHPSLKVQGGHNFVDGENTGHWDQDLEGHGTHCAGVIAAVAKRDSVWGYAPDAELLALRVFGGADGGGYASNIGDAVQWAADQGCDIINMSLANELSSSYLRQKIEVAADAGILCVAAAGNEGGPVTYPAKFRHVVGVSAIGQYKAYPRDSVHREAESAFRSSNNAFYLASFSNRGPEIDVCGPGVAVTSTLPQDVFGAWDGTSMACPHVVGVLALVLEARPQIKTAARDAARGPRLLDELIGICRDLGMARDYQGSGLPDLTQI